MELSVLVLYMLVLCGLICGDGTYMILDMCVGYNNRQWLIWNHSVSQRGDSMKSSLSPTDLGTCSLLLWAWQQWATVSLNSHHCMDNVTSNPWPPSFCTTVGGTGSMQLPGNHDDIMYWNITRAGVFGARPISYAIGDLHLCYAVLHCHLQHHTW